MPFRHRLWSVGKWVVDEGRHQLSNESLSVPVRSKLLAVLTCLIPQYPRTVESEFIIRHVWGQNSQTDRAGVSHAVWSLRQLLQDHDAAAPIIENIPRRGYRLCVEPRLLRPDDAVSSREKSERTYLQGISHWLKLNWQNKKGD